MPYRAGGWGRKNPNSRLVHVVALHTEYSHNSDLSLSAMSVSKLATMALKIFLSSCRMSNWIFSRVRVNSVLCKRYRRCETSD